MRDLEKIDINKINVNGYYSDLIRRQMYNLSDDEILRLRRMYKDNSIARNRKIINKNKKVALQKKSKYKKAKRIRLTDLGKKVVIGGVLVTVLSISVPLIVNSQKDAIIDEQSTEFNISSNMSENEPLVPNVLSESAILPAEEVFGPSMVDSETVDTETIYEVDSETMDIETTEASVQVVSREEQENMELVNKYCDIYHINFDVVYPAIVSATNNFINFNVDGLTCKGERIITDDKETFVLYYCRVARQLPGNINLNGVSGLYDNTDYVSGDNYGEIINYYSRLLGEDPILIYSIIQAETSWNSELFLYSNNPSGIRFTSSFASLSTKEEGIIETILEVLKYRRMGAETIADIRDIHAPLSDGNDLWLGNVTGIYEEVSLDPVSYLGSDYEPIKKR